MLAFVVVLGAAGGPPLMHPDSLAQQALETYKNHGKPTAYHYPALTVYANLGMYWAAYMLAKAQGSVASFAAFMSQQWLRTLSIGSMRLPFTLPGHILTLCFSVVGLFSTYVSGFRISDRRDVGCLAALLTGTSLLWVQQSHMDTVDIPLAAMCMLALALTLVWVDREDKPLWVSLLIGVATGLAASAKYNGAIVGVAFAGAALLAFKTQIWKTLLHGLVASVGAAATFLGTNPYIVRDYAIFKRDFLYEKEHAYKLGHLGHDTLNPWLDKSQALATGCGVVLLCLAAVGLAAFLRDRQVAAPKKAGLILFVAAFVAVVFRSILSFDRYVLPLVPVVGILAAVGARFLLRRALRDAPWNDAPTRSRVLAGGVGLLVAAALLPNLWHSIRHDLLLSRMDTREQLMAIMREARTRSWIASSTYTNAWVNQPAARSSNTFLDLGGPSTLNKFDLVVLDSFTNDRYVWALKRPQMNAAFRRKVKELAGWHALVISPYDRPKNQVPYANHSLYTPALPDLPYRRLPGPYIEIYARDRARLDELQEACGKKGITCATMTASDAFYYSNATAAR
ncbi:glycosyltransferase family 39 protein [Polyangium sp. 6x1]|uniref:ArnT family glycosyltransferase n=1 Tax=Polyangium sp. 6x1 TaxID=3042689 RepID=UPI002482E524|nr:glycosyltransferase family 39 protein [Polyangium sp. 6x1]MDI1444236.1 glycosyltransferase family 39 protein [Polyangium sp. 6x1]